MQYVNNEGREGFRCGTTEVGEVPKRPWINNDASDFRLSVTIEQIRWKWKSRNWELSIARLITAITERPSWLFKSIEVGQYC